MKKFLILILPVILLIITGCEEKTGVINCSSKNKDVVNEYTLSSKAAINYKGDIVESVKTIEIVESDSEEILDFFENNSNNTYNKLNSAYGGYTYEVIREDGKVTTNVTIDYSTMDTKKYAEDIPSLKKHFKEDGSLLVDGLIAIYENLGVTCDY